MGLTLLTIPSPVYAFQMDQLYSSQCKMDESFSSLFSDGANVLLTELQANEMTP